MSAVEDAEDDDDEDEADDEGVGWFVEWSIELWLEPIAFLRPLAPPDELPARPAEPPEMGFAFTLLRKILLILDTLGTLNLSQIPSWTSLSLISHAKIPGSRALSSLMNMTTYERVARVKI